MPKKTCFIITPIGGELTPTRTRVDQWEELIYKPALGKQFKIIRADKISAPGIITEQILNLIVNADLAIIDYTDLNPNVMYEAAIRHISHKPFIQIHPITLRLPFDISNLRSIPYDADDLQYPLKLSKHIKKAYEEMQDQDYKVPEILPFKFDLEKIVSDPVKFVEVLKQYLPSSTLNENLFSYQPKISEVYENPVNTAMGAVSLYASNRVKCPACGLIQNILINPIGTMVLGPVKHYRCNNCGAEFE